MVEFVAVGSIVIDDIVDPYGHSSMGMLGGGGSHAVAGMRVWCDQTALVSVIGRGFPDTAWQQLRALADTRGISQRTMDHPRAWQLFETDGTRHDIFRTDFNTFLTTTVQPDEFPLDFASARGIYLQTANPSQAEAWLTRLRSVNPRAVILWEPWEVFYKPEHLAGFREVAPRFDIVSPNSTETSWMIKETEPQNQAQFLFECGVRCIALRLGAEGSLVGTPERLYKIPAAPAKVVDETGAGNSYCGGFLVGYVESGGDPLIAGQYGAVSATFALAQPGLARLRPNVREEALRRLEQLKEMT